MEVQNREAGYDQLSKYIKRLELRVSEHNATPVFTDIDRRIELFKNMTSDELIHLLTISNGLLTDGIVKKWEGPKDMTVGFGDTIDFESPKNADTLLASLFDRLKADITPENIGLQSEKLYFGIIFSHLFSDGNGRLGRVAYSFMKEGRLPEKEKLITRNGRIQDMCERVNLQAVVNIFKKEGITDSDDVNVAVEYEANEKEDVGLGYFATVKYIAARRVLLKRGLFQEGQKKIYGDTWSPDIMSEYKEEYEKVKTEWFWETQHVVKEYDEWIQEQLDVSLT